MANDLQIHVPTGAFRYRCEGMRGDATFSLFSRRLTADRGYPVAAGLDDVVNWLEGFRFTTDGAYPVARRAGLERSRAHLRREAEAREITPWSE